VKRWVDRLGYSLKLLSKSVCLEVTSNTKYKHLVL
jgi:hypothetical protein